MALVGAIPPGLPELATPDLALVGQLIGPAAGVALMAFVESIAAARAFAAHDDPEVDADQELRALGTANLAGGCFQAFPAGGGLSQTAVNRGSGARSQLAGIATALVVVLTLLFLTPLFENLPEATLGAVVIVAVSAWSTRPPSAASACSASATSPWPWSRWPGCWSSGCSAGCCWPSSSPCSP